MNNGGNKKGIRRLEVGGWGCPSKQYFKKKLGIRIIGT